MHEYDVTLKSILVRTAGTAVTRLTGFAVERWHNVELPSVRHRRADLLGETSDGRLVHIELQSANQAHMTVRMLEYSLAIHRKFRRFPEQIVIYVGSAPLRMKRRIAAPGLSYSCRFADIRELDAEPLLASGSVEDNVIAILTTLGDEREAVRRILTRIGASEPAEREVALGELMILAGLRRLDAIIEREAEQMPILDDIMDHEVLGRERRRGKAELIVDLISQKLGPVPDWAKERLYALSATDLQRAGLRLLNAADIEDIFGSDG